MKVSIALAIAWALAAQTVGPLPHGGFLLNNGWRLDPAGKQIPVDTLPLSSALSPDGRWLLVLNAGYNPPSISVIDVTQGRESARTPVPDGWLGLAFSPRGDRVYVGGGSQASVFEFSFAAGVLRPTRTFTVVPEGKRTARDFIGDIAFTPDGHLIYAADLYRDSLVVINPQSGTVIDRVKTGRRPYRILFHPDGKSFFVTSWADGSLGHYQTSDGQLITSVRLGPHPTDMVWRAGANEPPPGETPWVARLFVAAANTNSVYSIGVSAAGELRLVETIDIGLSPRQPLGMTPSALALAPDAARLYVVCSDANAVASVDVTQDRGGVEGFIPAGWYPTAARALSDGRLIVLNGHGGGSHDRIQTGSVSIIDAISDSALAAYTDTVRRDSAWRDNPPQNPAVPPIEHVIYIVKEGGTYDEVLGSGGGSPNQRTLASQFVLLDNFFVNGDWAEDGKNWSTAAIASDYVQKLSPAAAAKRASPESFEGQDPAALPPAGYLWTNAATAGLSMRNYGLWLDARGGVRDPVLRPITNPSSSGFLEELAGFAKSGTIPRLIFLRLGNDDDALGGIVEAVSRSPFWSKTAIFAVQIDTGNGRDHVDSHHAPAFVISPYVKRHTVDSSMYNTTSMLRTIELLLKLQPMTQFDAAARPMTAVFQAAPDPTPYTAEKAR